ncbi:nucleic acid/nucleotide deaminase domain-containing protein [Streptomyces sp. NPDC088354]|uniref:nucleic acid/nucleotide deaminase domain-containing protein n=1 Tax=unclassified Streptomyces TaxID=2593676 RepID=UPI0029B10BF3|nr:nucleic acid/nucleotide deaminase domain-containing protein [Streptomyces sp. MI02-7b]MDX3073064.1 nucleic acid/nucleotide deaminase domain-containing protein [Streptomyces sp. MI02-7b]
MTLSERLHARFGEAGLRRADEFLLPLQVGPYFRTDPTDQATLGAYADSLGVTVPGAADGSWTRLGDDRGFELCADAEGVVRAVLLGYGEPSRFVSSSPETFAEGLLELDLALGAMAGADEPAEASAVFRRLEERLRAADPEAFADRENWWPLVLDDIRDTASAQWFAAMEVVDAAGEKKIFTQASDICLHPEERLWSSLQAAGVQPEQVTRIHTDLEACFMPGHYCSMWLGRVFPDSGLSHTFPYGETAASRAEGLRRLRESADA